MKLDRNRFSKKIGWCARRRALFTWNMWNRVKDWCRWLQEKMFSNKKGDWPIHSNCSKLPCCKKKCPNAQQQVTLRINRKSDQPRDQVQGSVSLLNRVGEGGLAVWEGTQAELTTWRGTWVGRQPSPADNKCNLYAPYRSKMRTSLQHAWTARGSL